MCQSLTYEIYLETLLKKYSYDDLIMYLNFELNSENNKYYYCIDQFQKNKVLDKFHSLLYNQDLLFSD